MAEDERGELGQVQLGIARLQLERERRHLRAEQAIGGAAYGVAAGTARLVRGVLRVMASALLGGVIFAVAVLGVLALQALASNMPVGADAPYRIGYRWGQYEGVVIGLTLLGVIGGALGLPLSRRAR